MNPEYKDNIKFIKDDYIKLLNSIQIDKINSHEYFVQNRRHIDSKGKYKIEDFVIKNPFMTLRGECYDDDEYKIDQIDKDTKSSLENLFPNPIK